MIVFSLHIPYAPRHNRAKNEIEDIFARHATDLTHYIAIRAPVNHAENKQGTGCFFKKPAMFT